MIKKHAATCTLLTLIAAPAAAQDTGWTYGATLYAWLPSLGASVETNLGTIESNSSGSDVLDSLQMAFMGTFEAQNGPWSVVGDLLYTKLGTTKSTPFGALYSDAEIETKVTALSSYLTYRVLETPSVAIDLGGGFRAFSVDLDLTLNSGTAAKRSESESETWVDPLLAGRMIFDFNEQWFGTAFADFGGTSSDETTWQGLATVGYKFNENWSMQGGYRYMEINHEIGGLPTTITMSGPILGGTYRF